MSLFDRVMDLSEAKVTKTTASDLRYRRRTGAPRQPEDFKRVATRVGTGEVDASGYATGFGKEERGVIEVHHDDGRVRIRHPHDSHAAKTLAALVRADPNIGRYHVRSQDDHHGTAQTFLKRFNQQAREPSSRRKLVLYHGTSDKFSNHVERHGLRPRGATKTPPTFGAGGDVHSPKASHADKVYLGHLSLAKDAAEQAARIHGGKAVVYRVEVPDHALLHHDEDSEFRIKQRGKTPTWFRSLHGMGSVAYKGRIPASHIKRHTEKEIGPGSWGNPSERT